MNTNNQTEYKKPLGTRLFTLLTVCMIVVAMAVPAFAASISRPYEPPFPYPSQYPDYYAICFYTNQWEDNNLVYMVSEHPLRTNGTYIRGLSRCYLYRLYTNGWQLQTSQITTNGILEVGLSDGLDSVLFLNSPLYAYSSNDVVLEPYFFDLSYEVTGVLPTVLSWIQQTLNSLFVEGGALQGLLLLVAVPVAITLLFLAARFIRNLIWGA